MIEQKAYKEVQSLVESIHGTMAWHPQGQGGEWHIVLGERALTVSIPKIGSANSLDQLYLPRPDIDTPTQTEHYSYDLRDDAIGKLRAIVDQSGENA